MNKSSLSALLGLGALGLASLPAASAASAPATEDVELEAVLITAQRAERVSRGATGLNLDIKDTPQSISVVTAELMQDFGANSLNEALRLAAGINVEEWETNRTNYLARGFEIKNTQIDGIGLPNNWGIVTGAQDAFAYDKIEVIRGANGLLTGIGNASGTINYVRKRPTNDTQALLNATVGSWDGRRVEADYSTPLTDTGSWAGRVVVAWDDRDSYLRSLQNDRIYLYGVVDGQIGARTTLTAGYSFQDADTTGNMWGALVLAQTDGTQAEFDRSASTTQDWTYWNTQYQNAFVELSYALNDDWDVKGTYNFRRTQEDDELFYAFGILDPVTHLGMYGWPGKWKGSERAHLGDISIAGRFKAFDRDHSLIVGVSQATGASQLDSAPILNNVDPEDGIEDDPNPFGPLPAFPYAGNVVPEPIWGDIYDYEHGGQWLRRVYGAARLSLADRVKAIVGFNHARFHRQGVNDVGTYYEQTESKLSPYAGITVDITGRVLAYASYSDIYQPQDQYDIDRNYLAPSKGVNLELGAKADWLNGRVLTSLAWFQAKQEGLATLAGVDDAGMYYYEGVDVDSKGFELEATGKLNDYVDLIAGFTRLKLTGQDGDGIYEWVPRHAANLMLAARLPALPALRLGIGGRWQGATSKEDSTSGVTIHQGSYAVLNAFGQWQASEHLSVRANVNNIADRKYIGSLYEVGYYGAPRNYSIGIDYRF